MADHQMGGIKLAEANSSRMPLMVSTKHASAAPASDIHIDLCHGQCNQNEVCCDCDGSKVPPFCLQCCIGGTD
ncbi:hypothetical protein D8674_042317 [Pyrus ussuriensis x Pyrus communis]|uniref:Uncharacterized protein n=1 Tax=Pyrus ussuriensis x Pyrus communis TaxID=2448454 RepID=A0A5N5HB40_9ROSA|nr:hypothetical protein D8674_016468 [Pyrus ussuriensis x Pyrus communis]KAB2631923.1 hypothetical protein D8674_042317 [Pyrus ussuriensis x Pyrus communis]